MKQKKQRISENKVRRAICVALKVNYVPRYVVDEFITMKKAA